MIAGQFTAINDSLPKIRERVQRGGIAHIWDWQSRGIWHQHLIAHIKFKEYREGNFKGNSTMDERKIFEKVTFSFNDIVENITIRFPMKRNNTKGERRKRTVKPENITTREIRYLNMGKCFEINLDQFDEPLGYIEFYLKMSGYIYVNSEGQFHNRDSFSKVEVKLGNCLWIELTYEVINQTMEGTCTRWKPFRSIQFKRESAFSLMNHLDRYSANESFDECNEREAERHLNEMFNCTIPAINSPNNLTVCPPNGNASEVGFVVIWGSINSISGGQGAFWGVGTAATKMSAPLWKDHRLLWIPLLSGGQVR